MSITRRTAMHDTSLRAVVTARRALHYALGGDVDEDRPAHVRAASSLAWIGGQIALVQDDANFVALVDAADGDAHVIALPRGKGGLRLFDDVRGNKKFKLDLEACAAIESVDGPVLLAFGSGSKKRRRTVVTIDRFDHDTPRVRTADATTFYELLETATAFAGGDMNIEGVLPIADTVRFFGRGNGATRRGIDAVNATCDVSLTALLEYLDDPIHRAPPGADGFVQYALGNIDGVSLGFTDAASCGADVLYTATAEASADATVDGAIAGSAVGVIDVTGGVRFAVITDANGVAIREKVEGLLLSRSAPGVVYLVLDPDDTTRPSELCTVALHGDWSASFS